MFRASIARGQIFYFWQLFPKFNGVFPLPDSDSYSDNMQKYYIEPSLIPRPIPIMCRFVCLHVLNKAPFSTRGSVFVFHNDVTSLIANQGGGNS